MTKYRHALAVLAEYVTNTVAVALEQRVLLTAGTCARAIQLLGMIVEATQLTRFCLQRSLCFLSLVL